MTKPMQENRTDGVMLYRAIFQQSAVGIARIVSGTGHFLETNQRFCEIVGYSWKELEKLTSRDISLPLDLQSDQDNMEQLLSGKIREFFLQKRYSRKDGSVIWVKLTLSPLWMPGEEPSDHLAIVEDITGRINAEDLATELAAENERLRKSVADHKDAAEKLRASVGNLIGQGQAEKELQQSNDLIQAIIAAAPIAIIGLDLDGNVQTVWNAAAEKMLGWSAEEVMGRPLPSVPVESQEEFRQVREMIRNGTPVQGMEVHRKRRDGTPIDYSIYASPLHDAEGRIIGNVAALVDITERKQVETRLYEQLHFLQQLCDSIPIPVYYKGIDGLYLGCNSAFEKFIGLPRSQVVGKSVYDLAPKEMAETSHAADRVLFQQPGIQVYETAVLHEDGTKHDIIFHNASYVDAEGRVAGIVGAITDVTRHKFAESERKNLETQLQQAQKMEAIGQLAGGIAHDFNNILTAIIGYAEIISLRLEKDSPFKHYVEQILASAERAADLTNGLLAFSRKKTLHKKPIDLCNVVRGLKKMLKRLITEDIEFQAIISEKDLVVMADKGQIEQVIVNLVTNASDAMPKGGALTIEISPVIMEEKFVHAHGVGEPGNFACISVSDTGHGMDETTRKKIFEPFFTTKEVGKGTGLGMAIIYGIIQQHDGCIDVFSEPGKGSTFRVYLPLLAEEKIEEHAVRNIASPARGTETILLAEDDGTVRELHRMMLEASGYKVITAVDGKDALDSFRKHHKKVDMLVTDVIMPKINGKSLFEEIRKVRPDVRALFMSGYTRDIVMERGMIEDEFNFINKPVMSSELLVKVREILDRI